jgi:hypothetical protein
MPSKADSDTAPTAVDNRSASIAQTHQTQASGADTQDSEKLLGKRKRLEEKPEAEEESSEEEVDDAVDVSRVSTVPHLSLAKGIDQLIAKRLETAMAAMGLEDALKMGKCKRYCGTLRAAGRTGRAERAQNELKTQVRQYEFKNLTCFHGFQA